MTTNTCHRSSLAFPLDEVVEIPERRDLPRFTVHVLLLCIDRQDRANLSVCARSALRSIYAHLHHSYLDWPSATGEAMSTILVAGWAVEL